MKNIATTASIIAAAATAGIFLLSACASEERHEAHGVRGTQRLTQLTPKGTTYLPTAKPFIRSILSGGPAQRAGLQSGDLVLGLNDKPIQNASDLDLHIKMAPKNSNVTIKRGSHVKKFNLILSEKKPRFGFLLEPSGVPVIKTSSPLISTIYKGDLTVHAQASLSEDKTELHVNFIIEKRTIEPIAILKMSVLDELNHRTLFRNQQNLDALGSKPYFLTQKIIQSNGIKSPVTVSLNLMRNNFVFEFQ